MGRPKRGSLDEFFQGCNSLGGGEKGANWSYAGGGEKKKGRNKQVARKKSSQNLSTEPAGGLGLCTVSVEGGEPNWGAFPMRGDRAPVGEKKCTRRKVWGGKGGKKKIKT